MKKTKNRWVRGLLITLTAILVLVGAGYIFLQYKISEIKNTLTGCNLESKNFISVTNFDYVNSWLIVQVKFDGSEKLYDFIFDTGAQTVISDSLVKELNPKSYKKSKINMNNKSAFKNELISLNSLEFGHVKFSNVGVIVVDNSKYKMLNCVSPWGIIGYNVIQTCNFQIDYKNKQMTLTDNIDNYKNLNGIHWISYKTTYQESPIIPININDSYKVNLLFDTGFSGGLCISSSNFFNSVNNIYSDKIAKYLTKQVITITDSTNNKPFHEILFKTKNIKIGDLETKDFVVAVSNSDEEEKEGLIGNKYFENYIITLNYKNKRVGFIENDSVKNNFSNKTFGLTFYPENSKIKIRTVYTNSEPEKQGIRVDDEVYSINNMKISDLPAETFCLMYRSEYDIINKSDTILNLGIKRDNEILKFQFKKYRIFK